MRYTPCGCRSADLVGVQTNFRLLEHSTMRRAPAMPHSVRSLPPRGRHSRLTIVRRGCNRCRIAGIHGAAMYTAPTLRSACSHSSCNPSMLGVEGDSPRPFSWGCKGDILFPRKRIPPLPRPHTLWGQKQPPALPSILLIVVPISPTKNKRLRAGHKTQHLPDDWLLEH